MNPFLAEGLAKEKVQRHNREMAARVKLYGIKPRRQPHFNLLELVKKVMSRRESTTLRKPNFIEFPGAIQIDAIFRKPIKEGDC